MSHHGDYGHEMTRRDAFDEQAIEALLAGRVPDGRDDLEELVGVIGILRSTASGITQPTAELAAVLAEGISTDKGDLPVTVGSNVHGPESQAAGLPKWRKNMIETAIAKLVSLSLAAKAALGTAVAAAALTGAGSAGVLPGPVQDAVADVVGAVTPFEFPSTADEHAELGERVAEDATDQQAPGVDGPDIADEASDGRADDAAEEARPEDASRPEDAGSQSSRGLDVADDTPAADHLPGSVPGSRDTADQYVPENTPGRGDTAGRETGDDASAAGRQTGDDAADSGRDTGDEASVSGRQTGDDASASGRDTGDEASVSGRQTGDDASASGPDTGEDASLSAQDTADDAATDGQEIGESHSSDRRP